MLWILARRRRRRRRRRRERESAAGDGEEGRGEKNGDSPFACPPLPCPPPPPRSLPPLSFLSLFFLSKTKWKKRNSQRQKVVPGKWLVVPPCPGDSRAVLVLVVLDLFFVLFFGGVKKMKKKGRWGEGLAVVAAARGVGSLGLCEILRRPSIAGSSERSARRAASLSFLSLSKTT